MCGLLLSIINIILDSIYTRKGTKKEWRDVNRKIVCNLVLLAKETQPWWKLNSMGIYYLINYDEILTQKIYKVHDRVYTFEVLI